MKMWSIYTCAIVATITALVIVHSGCCWAEGTRIRYVTSQLNERHLRNDKGDASSSWEVLRQWMRMDHRIVGGQAARIEDFPYMTSVMYKGGHRCSSIIITASWLLTAAHCVLDAHTDNLTAKVDLLAVSAGSAVLTTEDSRECAEKQVIHKVAEIRIHPQFDVVRLQHDLVLLGLASPLPVVDVIQPARLPLSPLDHRLDLADGLHCCVAGWGATRPDDDETTTICRLEGKIYQLPKLQKVVLPLLSIENCVKKYGWSKLWLRNHEHICTLSREGKDACSGDSGGPLVCNGSVVALVSWGLGCANETNPTVYTRIDTALPWIKKVTLLRIRSKASHPSNIIVIILLGQLAMVLASVCHV